MVNFCGKCRDKNFLMECGCGCGQIIVRRGLRNNKIKRFVKDHAGAHLGGLIPWNKKNFYSFTRGQRNYCKFCHNPIPLLNRHGDPQSYCKGHENKLKNPTWFDNRREKHGNWKGGRKLANKNGCLYWMILMPEHPRAKNNSGYVYEHILVAEQKLGRPLRKGEVVHHIDGNGLNNDPNNLLVLPSQSEHMKIHKITLTRGPIWDDLLPNLN